MKICMWHKGKRGTEEVMFESKVKVAEYESDRAGVFSIYLEEKDGKCIYLTLTGEDLDRVLNAEDLCAT